MTTPDPAALVHEPLGLPGSGRVRYGAAMALFREGRIGPAELEVYRETAAFDARDPALVLAERGLSALPAPSAADALERLLDQVGRFVNDCSHPGRDEVAAGLARARLANPSGPTRKISPRSNPVVARWLRPALSAMDRALLPLADCIAKAAPHLDWVTYDAYQRDRIGAGFAENHAFASLIGEEAPFAATDYDLGVFLIAPHVLYRDRAHAAPEFYAPLTGPHGWRFAPGAALELLPPGVPVWNPPHRPHLTKVGSVPFLCIFAWTRDVNEPALVLDAGDWPELEALRLD